MSGRKFDLNNAALLKRIAARLADGWDRSYFMPYRHVVAAMRAENVYSPETKVDDLIRYLANSDEPSARGLAVSIGAGCAYELDKVLRASRRHVDAFVHLAETVSEIDGGRNAIVDTVVDPVEPSDDLRKAVLRVVEDHEAEKALVEAGVAMVEAAAEEEGAAVK